MLLRTVSGEGVLHGLPVSCVVVSGLVLPGGPWLEAEVMSSGLCATPIAECLKSTVQLYDDTSNAK